MLLGIKTDSPVTELYLYDDKGKRVDQMSWESGRGLARGLLAKLDEFLRFNSKSTQDLTGLFVYQGPGSFTGLRIGVTVMNTLAYSLSIPVVGSRGDEWLKESVDSLLTGSDDRVVLPFYGADARVTSPNK